MSLIPYHAGFGPVLDRWFEDRLPDRDLRPLRRTAAPAVDVSSDDDGLVVRLEVPGIPPENLSVETRDRVLVIEAKASEEGEGKTTFREFTRSFRVPADLDPEKVEARHEHGVLTLRIPRLEATRPRRIDVQVH